MIVLLYNTYRTFYYTVTITDNNYTVNETLTIQLVDVNDNAPMFDKAAYTFDLSENTPVSPIEYIGNVSASDLDSGVQVRLT